MHRSTTILLLLGVVCLVGSSGAQPEGDEAFQCLQSGPSILSICEKELALAQASFSDGQCLCQPILRGILPTVGVQIPAINSILKIMEQACGNFEIVECA
ncbi:hypothetical protein M9435_003614 [Picochlorum sp. BPE23]|nr:hypothetical protein M9435_003614 [Picochlorum sp. BPE23]